MVEIRPATFMDLAYIAINMREWDRKEIFATLNSEQPVDFAQFVMRISDVAHIAYKDRTPVAAVGAHEMWPGVWSVWAFGTDRFSEVGLSLTRFVRKTLIPALIKAGAHRGECRSIEGHTEAHRWLEALGMQREAEHPGMGKSGETFYTYSRLHTKAAANEVEEAA